MAEYTVSAEGLDDAIRPIGIVGPGLRAPSAHDGAAASTAKDPLQIRTTLDCSLSGWSSATSRDYRIRVRHIIGDAPATTFEAPLGSSAGDWRDLVQRTCLRRVVSRLLVDHWTVAATPGSPQVDVSLRVRNPAPFPFQLKVSSWGTGVSESTPTITLPAGGMATLSMKPLVERCTAPLATPYFYVTADGSTYLVLRVGLRGLLPPTPDDPQLVGLLLTRPQLASLNGAMARACRGAPPVTSTVTGVHRDVATEADLRLRIDVSIRVHADQVEFGAASLIPDSRAYPSLGREATPEVTLPPAATARGGTAHARLLWALSSCVADFGEVPLPPSVQFTVVVAGRRYSSDLVLADRMLLNAFKAACLLGSEVDAEAAFLGWRVSG